MSRYGRRLLRGEIRGEIRGPFCQVFPLRVSSVILRLLPDKHTTNLILYEEIETPTALEEDIQICNLRYAHLLQPVDEGNVAAAAGTTDTTGATIRCSHRD